MATATSTRPIPPISEPPLVGSLAAFAGDRLALLRRIARECGDVGCCHVGPSRLVLFNAPELVHAIMVEHAYDFDAGPIRHAAFQPVIGNGLLNSEGDLHRRQRKVMAPLFQPRQVAGYADIMVRYAERAQAEWADGLELDVWAEMTRVTMAIIGKVLFDADVFNETDDLSAALTVAQEYPSRVFATFLPIPITWPVPGHARMRRAIATVNERIQRLIDARRATEVERDDLLSVLLRARDEDGAGMSDAQIRDEALTLFAAGHETTSVALSWAWYLLANHPDAYARLRAEAREVLDGRPPTYDDLPRLEYARRVLKEALRLYPPAYLIVRAPLREIEIGGYSLRRGDSASLAPYTLHRRPDTFPDPERFDPDRFAPDAEARLPRLAYMPFGAGPHICIGNHFALMEGQLLLAALAQRVTFELLPGQRIVPDPQVTLRPKTAIRMRVRRLDATEGSA